MSRPRRKYTKDCPECLQPFHPHRREQECCSHSCAAARSFRRSEPRQTSWWKASVATRRPGNVARLAEQLKGCATLGEAYRLGFTKGYAQGYQANERKRARRVA